MEKKNNQKTIIRFSKNDLITLENNIQGLMKKKEINFPKNFSVSNAIKSSWLILNENQAILTTCTKESIYMTLFKTLILGLNPAKKQVYFIPYGNKLQPFISYFGILAILKRLPFVIDVKTEIIYKGDTFEYEIVNGQKIIKKHIQKFQNIISQIDNIEGAYCIITYLNKIKEKDVYIEIMNTEQIKRAWNKSKVKEKEVHKCFPEEMVKRTIIMRACKKFINTSDDSDLNLQTEFWKTIEEEYNDTEIKENNAIIEMDIPENINIQEQEQDQDQDHDQPQDQEQEQKQEQEQDQDQVQPQEQKKKSNNENIYENNIKEIFGD